MVHRGSISILALACGIFMSPASLRGEDSQVRIELSCKTTADPGLKTGRTLLMEIQSPGGETICKAFARAGQSVRFRRLKPRIVVACVTDRSGGYSCESVNLYPPPSVRVARFSVELKSPAPAPQAERFYMVSQADLSIPEKARREFGQCMRERRGGNTPGALRHLERALEIHPEYPEALTNLGAAWHPAGDYARALQYFERVTDDPFGVRGVEGVGDLGRQIENLVCSERLSLNAMLQCPAVKVLHGDEVAAFVFVDVVDGADVGVIQPGGGAGFPLESLERMAIPRQLIRQELQGDGTF